MVWQTYIQSLFLLSIPNTWYALLLMAGSADSNMFGLWPEQQQQSKAGISVYIMAIM
jgi:hypothetical protein